MTRPLRIEFPGALYHVTSRGNASGDIYLSDEDRLSFVETLARVVDTCGWVCHAYCLMSNHYHLLIETPGGNLSRGMRDLNGTYSQAFNRKYKRVGHLMQGRYKSPIVQDDAYFLELARYIVLNPVRSRLVEGPGCWPWSSYLATTGLEVGGEFLDTSSILAQFSDDLPRARALYSSFVIEGMGSPAPERIGDLVFGGEVILPQVKKALATALRDPSYRREDRFAARVSLLQLFGNTRKGQARNKAIRGAYFDNGYTMSQIAAFLGVNCSTVSRAIDSADAHNLDES